MRTDLKAALLVDLKDIRADYYGLLDKHLTRLLAIFEQDGRNEKERKRILIADLCALGAKRVEETPAGETDYLDWLDDLIEGHIGQVMDIGVFFPANNEMSDEDITNGFSWAYVLMNASPKLKRYLSESGWIVSRNDEAIYKILRESREKRTPLKAPGKAGIVLKTPRESHREKTYFKAAIEAGLMEGTETGYFWKGSRASLCRFLGLVYGSNGTPFKALEALFEYNRDGKPARVIRLDVGIPNALNCKIEPEIDKLFNNE